MAEFIGAVNSIEGRVVEQEGDRLLIRSESLGCDLVMNHKQPLPEGTPVTVAVRPEKLVVSEQAPDTAYNTVMGVITDFAYLGDVSIYLVRLPTGQQMRVQLTNIARLTENPLTWDQEVYLSWMPDSGVVFAS